MLLTYFSLLLLIGWSASAPSEASDAVAEGETEVSRDVQTCVYTDEKSTEITLTYDETEPGIFYVIKVTPRKTDDVTGRLSKCFELEEREEEDPLAGLESKNAKRRKNKRKMSPKKVIREGRPPILLQQIRNLIRNPASEVSTHDIEKVISYSKRFIEVRKAFRKRAKRRKNRN